MTDIVDSRRRSEIMARIRGRDTAPELTVRRISHGLGFRFRLHRKDLPGALTWFSRATGWRCSFTAVSGIGTVAANMPIRPSLTLRFGRRNSRRMSLVTGVMKRH